LLSDKTARGAFYLAVGRWPSDGEERDWRRHLASLEPDPEVLMDTLLRLQGQPALAELAPYRSLSLSAELQHAARVDRALFERLYAAMLAPGSKLVVGQAEYLSTHRARFWETINACHLLLGSLHKPRPRMLDFGASEFSALYKQILPDLEFDLSDCPTPEDYPGFTEEVARRVSRCDAFYTVDLEQAERGLTGAGVPLAAYDLILFTEVLEHLIVNPVELLRALFALLKPGGILYLTTPNLFRRENLEKIAARENPQAPYPPTGDNWDRHYHYREYAAPELARFLREAGGEIIAFYFSDCWDDDPGTAPEERGNLVFAARRPKA
jgi:SAM-dependent methyltransferase